MIEATQRKLREARFFFDHLVNECRRAVHTEPEAFGFYLSVFLSAARSVTFALQYEEKAKYLQWFNQQFANLSAEHQSLFKFFTDQRNYEQKRGGAEVAVVWESVPVTRLTTERATHPTYGFHSFGPPGTAPRSVEIPVPSFELGSSNQEVTSACQCYLELLGKLVEDFVRAYS